MLTHEIVIFWNGTVVFEGRCTVAMGYEVAAMMRGNFASSREFGDPLTLDSFLSVPMGRQISGTIDDEKPGKVRTGQAHWRFTNHGD